MFIFLFGLDGDENFFISPLSIYSALSLCLAGAKSESMKELVTALHVEPNKDTNAMIKLLGENLQSVTSGDDEKTLVQANCVFLQKGVQLQSEFKHIVTECFKAVLEEVSKHGLHSAFLFR